MVVLTVHPLQGSPTRTRDHRAHELGQPRPSRSERERQRTKRRIWHQPIDSSSPEPIDSQTRQPTRDQATAFEPCEPSPVGTGPAQGVQGDVRSEASRPPAGGARGGRSSPRKTGGVRGTESPADERAVSPEPTSTVDTVFCRRNARLVRVRDPYRGRTLTHNVLPLSGGGGREAVGGGPPGAAYTLRRRTKSTKPVTWSFSKPFTKSSVGSPVSSRARVAPAMNTRGGKMWALR